jgi:phosphoribosyl-AMP cyclohydrolase
MSPFTFRAVQASSAADATAVADVMIASRREHQPFAPLAHSPADVREWVRDSLLPTHHVMLACDADGRVVGFIATHVAERLGWIDQLHFAPGHTGRGGGSALLQQALAQLPRTVRLYTFQPNTGARRFYERHGFRAVHFGDGSGNEERCPDVLYELRGMNWLDDIRWDHDGLVPVIAQEVASNDVLMFAFMNREALAKTAELGRAVYWSRSRGKLWFKGEESGHVQTVHEIRLDCDNDVVLLKVTQQGHDPGIACHTGRHSCFFQKLQDGTWHSVEPVLKDPERIYK